MCVSFANYARANGFENNSARVNGYENNCTGVNGYENKSQWFRETSHSYLECTVTVVKNARGVEAISS